MISTKTTSYKDLIVWQKAVSLTVLIYKLTKEFPREEIFGLTLQIRRATLSILSNISEGRMRGMRRDHSHFLRIAYSSGAKLETHIIISKQLPKTKLLSLYPIDQLLDEVMKMLHVMIFDYLLKAYQFLRLPNLYYETGTSLFR